METSRTLSTVLGNFKKTSKISCQPYGNIKNIVQEYKNMAVKRRIGVQQIKVVEALKRNQNNTYTCIKCIKSFKPQGITIMYGPVQKIGVYKKKFACSVKRRRRKRWVQVLRAI